MPPVHGLPPPFDAERYSRLRTGIYDDPGLDVYVNEAGDFAHLSPLPTTDYRNYASRVKRLGLEGYKKKNAGYALRYQKLVQLFAGARSFLEIGAGAGGFLAHVREQHPDIAYACIEPDENSRNARAELSWLRQFEMFDDAPAGSFELVGLFHVLEHVLEPVSFLRSCAGLLSPNGRLIVEVPSLDDPLLSLYHLESYENFFFQRQHPFYYSASSLKRLLESTGFVVESVIFHQRYGIENHLSWLQTGKPGGSAEFRSIFGQADKQYRASLEASGHSDAAVAVARCVT